MPEEETLAAEHREFVPLLAAIEKAEASIADQSPRIVRMETEVVQAGLAHGLMPHSVGEGRTVFPVLRRVTGGTAASQELNRQHREISRLTTELERVHDQLVDVGISPEQERRLREVLEALRRTVQEHLEGEQEICFSVLQAELSPEEAHEVCAAMEEAAAEVRRLYE